MDFNLEFWLVAATTVAGLIWLTHRLLAKRSGETKEPIIVEYARSFFPVLLVVLLLRSFLAEPFRIPSGSMLPTLEIGDFILVNKYAYGLRLPVLHTKILQVGEPKAGDVFVFRYPKDPSTDFIKRVIGVPGDVIEWDNKILRVNGVEVSRELIGPYDEPDQAPYPALRLKETQGDIKHDILLVPNTGGRVGSITVPEGHYFAMGDNRDNSNDSRVWGLVPEENLVGKAIMIWMNLNLKFGRIGDWIQ